MRIPFIQTRKAKPKSNVVQFGKFRAIALDANKRMARRNNSTENLRGRPVPPDDAA